MFDRRTVLTGGVAFASCFGGQAVAKSLAVGDVAPAFSLVTFDRQKVNSEDLRGQVIVLNYWATWCAPCRAELPQMDTYYRRHGAEGLKMFAIATESSVPERYLKPLASVLSFPLIHRLQGRGYGLVAGSVPTNFIIDRAGVIRHAKAGSFDYAGLEAALKPLLAEAAPPGLAVRQSSTAPSAP